MLRRVSTRCVVGVMALALLFNCCAVKAQDGSTPQMALSETRVFVNESCPSSQVAATTAGPLLIALATALLPKVIDFGVSYASRALQNQADEEKAKNRPVQAGGLGWLPGFYRHQVVNGKPSVVSGVETKCLVVVRGSFAGDQAKSKPCSDYPKSLSAACDWLRRNGVSEVGIYLESQFVLSDDGASFRLQPERLVYVRPLSLKPDTDTGMYDLSFTINFEARAATTSVVSTFGLSVLSFEQIRQGSEYDESVLAGKSSGWTLAMPITAFQEEINRVERLYSDKRVAEDKLAELKANPKADDELKANPKADEKEIADLQAGVKSLSDQISTWKQKSHALGPTNIVVKMTEQPHLPQNVFLLTAAEVFANSKSEISQAISDNLNQVFAGATSQGQSNKIASQGALVIAALNASLVVDQKQAALDQIPQAATDMARKMAARELEIAKIQANVAYVAAGQAPPYSDVFGGKPAP